MLDFFWGHYLYLLSVLTAHCTHRCRRCWCLWSCPCASMTTKAFLSEAFSLDCNHDPPLMHIHIHFYIYIYLCIQMSSMSFHTCIHAIGDMICKDMQTNTFTERVQDSMCHSQDKPLKHSSLQCDTCRCGSCISARTHSIGRKLSFYNRGDHD